MCVSICLLEVVSLHVEMKIPAASPLHRADSYKNGYPNASFKSYAMICLLLNYTRIMQ